MRKFLPILAIAASIFLSSGCDFFRTVAGRPTSSDIQAKKILIANDQRAHQARLDSLKTVQKQISDSLEVMDSIHDSKNSVVSSRQLSNESKSSLEYRYYIIIGAFGKQSNAEKLSGRSTAAGYPATLIHFRNGFTYVGICPSNSILSEFATLKKVRGTGLCPDDAWILDSQ